MLKEFNMENCKPASTQMDPALELSTQMSPSTAEEKDNMAYTPYRSFIGALLYAATGTRPDIFAAVAILCRFNQNPGRNTG